MQAKKVKQTEEKKKKDNNGNKYEKRNIEFIGLVMEVHSGDTLTIKSVKSGRVGKFNLTNIRAPQINKSTQQPLSFESKEFVRKMIIGREVKVWYEYDKSFTLQKSAWNNEDDSVKPLGQTVNLSCATIFVDEKNLNVLLLEQGLAKLQNPYSEEEKSQYYQQLKEASDIAEKKKVGLHNNNIPNSKKFNDISLSKNTAKAMDAFSHLQNSKLTGVVELVLNGSRLKVRINEQQIYVIMLLDGIRCLPNDENLSGYTEWSNKALQYTKENLLQRDVQIKISSVDKKGVFHGNLTSKKVDFAEELVKNGLAICYGQSEQSYINLEKEAKEKKIGLWGSKIQLDVIRTENEEFKQIQVLNIQKKGKFSEVIDLNEFYIHENNSKMLNQLDEELANFQPKDWPQLKGPINKKNTPCVALFPTDKKYYRAHVIKPIQNKKDVYLVHYIDYGNYDQVDIEDIRKMPDKYVNIEPQALNFAFAYIVGPNKKHQLYQEATEFLMDQAWDKPLNIQIAYKEGGINYGIISVGDDQVSLNEKLVKEGYATLDQSVQLPQKYQNWEELQANAETKKLGIWLYQQDEEDA